MLPEHELVFLDTSILVAYIRANKLANLIESKYKLKTRSSRPLICVVTVGEMWSLTRQFGWGQDKCEQLKQLLQELVVVDINSEDILSRYAEIDYNLLNAKPAKTIGKNDMWIAATASAANAFLITTDKDFRHIDNQLLKLIWIDETEI